MEVHNLIIIGAGPAGYTAAIYAARAELKPLLFEGDVPGGQLTTTTEVENFPGFPKGILGPDLMVAMREQALRFGTEVVSSLVTAVDFKQHPFKIEIGERVEYTKSVIISTGASARRLGLASEAALYGKGVSACATCDGFFFKGKDVVVVGGGDSAMEESLFLTRFANSVKILVRTDKLRASKIMQDRALNHAKISFLYNVEVTEVLGVEVGKVTGIKINNRVSNEISEMKIDGVFAAIGHVPNTAMFKDQITTNEVGYILVEPGTTKTNIPGVFASGDVADWKYRQAITAAGTGCAAALDAQKFLEGLEK